MSVDHSNNSSLSVHSADGDDHPPFFADVTLDLAEAHDIAMTPELTHKSIVVENAGRSIPTMPVIPDVASPNNGTFTELEMTSSTPAVSSGSTFIQVGGVGVDAGGVGNSNPLSSITSDQTHGKIARAFGSRRTSQTSSSRRWPRDIPWAVGFCIIVPMCLLLPILLGGSPPTIEETEDDDDLNTDNWLATATAPRLATIHTLLWGYAASLVLSRLLYRTMGGGDGDDARHIASQILLASAPISVSVYICLVVSIYMMAPKALHYAVVPLWFLARDLYLFRSWKMTATTPGGRQAFFQALTCMTLDILSRSLRRSSFYRIISALLVVQLFVIMWWRIALMSALRSQSLFWIGIAFLGGKWATGTVARLLSLIASGGISSWFAEQNALVEEFQSKQQDNEGLGVDEEMIEFTSMSNTSSDDRHNIPEAYRTASASAYKSALSDPDEGIDDDFDDEEEINTMRSRNFLQAPRGSTVKQLLFSGLTVSFGSVAKCGLLGGMAQFIWSQLRKIDTARATLGGLQGMSVGHNEDHTLVQKYLAKANLLAREFVRSHSDMAMSHVAAFQKSYQRAAQDVAILIDESGVEPIIHDDISTHMSACVGGSVSGVIVIFTGSVLVHARNRNAPDVSDSAVVMDMLLAFIFCYTLIFTVMEPLRASIKAVYVSFAQHPQSLSQAFPLIFHRLTRMSRSNLQ